MLKSFLVLWSSNLAKPFMTLMSEDSEVPVFLPKVLKSHLQYRNLQP